jgi:3-oxoadipate enol-lactonase
MPMTPARDGVAINYETRGNGPPLTLISGTGHDLTFWAGQTSRFAREFRTIVFDNRGVGASSVPAPGYTIADMADDAVHVLDSVGIDRAHVMGFSMGGHIA